MIPPRTKTFQILLLVSALAFVLAACNSDAGSGDQGDFVLNLYNGASEVGGETVAFDELVAREGRPILLNFWAGNCPPCRAEMPALQAAWEQFGNEVLFIGVDIGPYVNLGSYGQGKDLIEEFGITYPTGSTGNRNVVIDWGVASMPTTFFLNRNGRVHDSVLGAMSSSRLTQKVRELIAANAS
ncbi:MAG: TlpA disulfide reductase family protein [Chloroflexi bacterium]|nr:TlpA disulfide reductase family protein [Chloroflexota bacterium]